MESAGHHNLPLGAHLVTPRRGYLHHGIYVGEGRVVHYAGFNRLLRRGPVEEVPLERFARGRGVQLKSQVAPKFDGAERVQRARSRIGEDRYRLLSNNCEHFSEWVINGSSRSPQVEALKSRIGKPLEGLKRLAERTRVQSLASNLAH